MTALRGWPIQRDGSANGSTPKGVRLGGLLGLLGFRSSSVPEGVMVDGSMDPVVTGNGAGMSYRIRAAQFVSKYSDANGPTIFANDAEVVVTTTAAPGSNSRRDLVWARQNLPAADGGSGTDNTAEFGVVQGTAAASPATPATPAGAVAIGYFIVTSGVTNTAGLTYVQLHQWRTAAGGLVPTDKGARTYKVWNGSSEQTIVVGVDAHGASEATKAIAYQKVGVVNVTLNSNGDGEIVFPSAFPTALLQATIQDASPVTPYGAMMVKWTSGASSRTKLTLRVYDAAGAVIPSVTIGFSYSAWGY